MPCCRRCEDLLYLKDRFIPRYQIQISTAAESQRAPSHLIRRHEQFEAFSSPQWHVMGLESLKHLGILVIFQSLAYRSRDRNLGLSMGKKTLGALCENIIIFPNSERNNHKSMYIQVLTGFLVDSLANFCS